MHRKACLKSSLKEKAQQLCSKSLQIPEALRIREFRGQRRSDQAVELSNEVGVDESIGLGRAGGLHEQCWTDDIPDEITLLMPGVLGVVKPRNEPEEYVAMERKVLAQSYMLIEGFSSCNGVELQLLAVNRDELERQVDPRCSLLDLDENPLSH